MPLGDKNNDWYHGDPAKAEKRIRELVEEACHVLPAHLLNLLSGLIATFIDSEMGQHDCRLEIITNELKSERRDMDRVWRALGKKFASAQRQGEEKKKLTKR